jgi:hypothetical protein
MKQLLLLLLFSTMVVAQTTKNELIKEELITEYKAETGDIIKVGEKIKVGLPSAGNQFVYITQGNLPCGTIIANQEYLVKKIKVVGSKKRGFKAFALFSGFGLSCYIEIETALMVNEISMLK